MSRLKALASHGQSVWLDYIDRPLIDDGRLRRLIDTDGLAGVTSNPAIFQKAIANGEHYDAVVRELAPGSADAKALYEAVAIRDIRDAADVLRPVYDATAGADGFVSLEVSPLLARDTAGTIDEARRLWVEVGRPNLMVKVPGTPEGMPAIETLIAEGINVNVTLLFSRTLYAQAAQAYLAGLERRHTAGQPVNRVASVASFFVSRIDTAADRQLAAHADAGRAGALRSRVAIANAQLAYADYLALAAGERATALRELGARPQRLLWASTSTKDPGLSDVLYIETLIGADTVNTMPPATMDAFRDHGEARDALTGTAPTADALMAELAALGLELEPITDDLLEDGIRQFADAFEALLGAVDGARQEALARAPG